MTQPTPSAPGFVIDFADAPAAIRNLEDAKAQLENVRNDAFLLGRVEPPANDPVSRDAATVLSAAAVGGPRSFVAVAEEGIRNLQIMIDGLRAELDEYRRAESEAASSIASVDRA